jgi:hypothetical protein
MEYNRISKQIRPVAYTPEPRGRKEWRDYGRDSMKL